LRLTERCSRLLKGSLRWWFLKGFLRWWFLKGFLRWWFLGVVRGVRFVRERFRSICICICSWSWRLVGRRFRCRRLTDGGFILSQRRNTDGQSCGN